MLRVRKKEREKESRRGDKGEETWRRCGKRNSGVMNASTRNNWIQMSPSSVCFGSKDDSYGSFTIPTPGKINTFKLTYLYGNINCAAYSWSGQKSRWGCNGAIGVHITYTNKSRLLPANSSYMTGGDNCDLNEYYYFPWAITEGEELCFDEFSSPLSMSVGEQFQVWFIEDLKECGSEWDNTDEQTCAEVYGFYAE
ncbi:hypothetical protein ACROYT_G030540 [Oculina patagonica]